MQLIGNKLVIPLFDAELSQEKSYDLCNGISIFTLSENYGERLRSKQEILSGYVNSLPYMKCGLALEPEALEGVDKTDWSKLMEFGVFIALTIRLASGVPLDIPYWFDVDNEEIKGYGKTLIRTYRNSNRYLYPLDDGMQYRGLIALQEGIADIAKKHIQESSKNVLIRAIEFVAIGFQNRNIPSRLVNNTIFLESLFSHSNVEISFQIASSVSWYLKSENNVEERIALFNQIKELYGWRSKIVHGADISSKSRNLRDNLLFSEKLNTNILQNILTQNHVETFSMSQKKRQRELRKLSLGASGALMS